MRLKDVFKNEGVTPTNISFEFEFERNLYESDLAYESRKEFKKLFNPDSIIVYSESEKGKQKLKVCYNGKALLTFENKDATKSYEIKIKDFKELINLYKFDDLKKYRAHFNKSFKSEFRHFIIF